MTHALSDENRARLAGKTVVASVSGGKDSAAMSLWLTEQGVEHRRVFADTGWEHEDTYTYLRGPLTLQLGPIEEVRAKQNFEEMARSKAMMPSRIKRWCTRGLKVEPLFAYMNALAEAGHDLVNAIGIRAAESQARGKLPEWEETEGLDGEVWRPLLAWTEEEVIALHKRHGLPPNPLYLRGAKRVGCWPCIFASKDEIRLVAETDPARIDRIRALEAEITQGRDERRARQGLEPLQSAGFFQSMRPDATGRYPTLPIDKVVAWSKTTRGGKQLALFGPPADDGCMRWGMCETEASQ